MMPDDPLLNRGPTPLVDTFGVGNLKCHALNAGTLWLDGGAMFGVVPKPLWEKKIPADSANRIPLAMRCLLVEHPRGLILVDTGVGGKETEKAKSIFNIQNEGEKGATRLDDALLAAGHKPSDVDFVINTHLHFDHAGGNTRARGDKIVPAFENATYVVQRAELRFAEGTDQRTAAAYPRQNFEPIRELRKWLTVDGETEFLPGVELLPTPGHVPHHQSVLIGDSGEHVCFLGDVMPTSAHVPVSWTMGYDLEPLRTMESKSGILSRAAQENWLLALVHDYNHGLGRVSSERSTYRFAPIDFGPDSS